MVVPGSLIDSKVALQDFSQESSVVDALSQENEEVSFVVQKPLKWLRNLLSRPSFVKFKATNSAIHSNLKLEKMGQLTAMNGGVRAGLTITQSSAIVASAGTVTIAGFGAAIASLQFIQGFTLIYLASKLLPQSREALKQAQADLEKAQSRSSEFDVEAAKANLKTAQLTHWNHQSLRAMGVLFLLLGSIGAIAFIGAQVGLASVVLTSILAGGGAILSLLSIGLGALNMYRAMKNLKEIHQYRTLLFDQIRRDQIDLRKFIDQIAPKNLDSKSRWVLSTRVLGESATEKLKEFDTRKETSRADELALARALCQGTSDQLLKQRILFGLGLLMTLGGVISAVSTAFAPPISSMAVVAAGLGIGSGITGISSAIGSGCFLDDSSSLFQRIKKGVDRFVPTLPKEIDQKLSRTE